MAARNLEVMVAEMILRRDGDSHLVNDESEKRAVRVKETHVVR